MTQRSRTLIRKNVARLAVVTLLAATLVATRSGAAQATGVQRVKYTGAGDYLVVEFLNDNLVHFEMGVGAGPSTSTPIPATDQIADTNYPGPTSLIQNGNTASTPDTQVDVNTTTMCATVTDLTKTPTLALTTICPRNLTQDWKGLSFAKDSMQNAYGLGEQFTQTGSADGDWVGRTRTSGPYGNAMQYDSSNGPVANAQIPVLYAVGPSDENYALFVDQVYKQDWDLTGDPWTMDTYGDQLRWYLMTGPNLPALRHSYMQLTGTPPVPPKKVFGLWQSIYGYHNWTEIDNTLASLRADGFPVDGFMLDLQWYGGVTAGSDDTPMGKLTFDTTNFPDPATKIADYRDNEGIGLMTIEEPYVGKGLPEYTDLANRGYLVRAGCSTCDPVYLTSNDWWGKGSMIDFTQPAAGAYWAATKRQPLVDMGIMGHWLDLDEPEMYDPNDWTAGVLPGKHAHADYHNLYALEWARSVADGYATAGDQRRPFTLSRSGAGGIQRYGTAMWSGDIGSMLTALADQQNVQMNMSMSGIDYFGSDVGGYHRDELNTDLNELYTQWFANSAWFDTPLRPHADNSCGCNQTAPDEVGDTASNKANLQQRYALTPYYYSLAHNAYSDGDPVIPPLVYYYQNDPNVRTMGSEKMVGPSLLIGVVAGAGERERNMYLPAGTWYDYRTNKEYTSTGQWFDNIPEYVQGKFSLPAFAKAGAILPKMYVDDKTMNVFGRRTDGSTRDELITQVYPSTSSTSFKLTEDDGKTIAYQSGAERTTNLSQQESGSTETVTIGASSGTYIGAPSSRDNVVKLISSTQASAVTLNGAPLTEYATEADFDAASSGWFNAGNDEIEAKSGSESVTTAKTFAFTLGQAPVTVAFSCANGTTTNGQSVYVVGSVPALGDWAADSAVKLDPTNYPTWTGTIGDLPPNTTVQWKCIKRQEANYPDTVDQWQPDPNNSVNTPASGYGGTSSGSF
jgi:alpha-glucosidase